jgi:hypothetical protein
MIRRNGDRRTTQRRVVARRLVPERRRTAGTYVIA